MPYVTIEQRPYCFQITLDDILANTIKDVSRLYVNNVSNTRTKYYKQIPAKHIHIKYLLDLFEIFKAFNTKHQNLFKVERESLYKTFKIPKKSGGYRTINQPEVVLSSALLELKDILERDCGVLYHTSAFAYVKKRSTKHALQRHQSNKSRWFLKLDLKDFFGSTTLDFLMDMFSNLYPFSEMIRLVDGSKDALRQSLSLCMLNGGLPQGSPISPLLTNVMMIPIDHHLCNGLRKMSNQLVYTRYADDMIISSKKDFKIDDVTSYIHKVFDRFNAPFQINNKKTRYGSSSGQNWNLGLMLNQNNQITIGHKKAHNFKAMCLNYLRDKSRGITWTVEQVQKFQGNIAYYRMIEKDYINHTIEQYNKKFKMDMEKLIKLDLRS